MLDTTRTYQFAHRVRKAHITDFAQQPLMAPHSLASRKQRNCRSAANPGDNDSPFSKFSLLLLYRLSARDASVFQNNIHRHFIKQSPLEQES